MFNKFFFYRKDLEDVDEFEGEAELTDEGFYNITDAYFYKSTGLPYPTDFVCEITIPGTSYSVKKSLVYYPGMFLFFLIHQQLFNK